MASIINASSTGSGGIVQTADASGVLQLQSNGTVALTVSGSTVTFASAPSLPAGSITQASLATGVAGTGPAFSAYQSTLTSVAHNTNVKIDFQTEAFDTNNNFASSRFTPTVAGYYNVYAQVNYGMTSNSFIMLYKNGSLFSYGPTGVGWSGISGTTAIVQNTVSMNGTTDYLEIYAYQATGSTQNTTALQTTTFFTGFLARSA